MAHEWSVVAMDYNVSQDGNTNVVHTVHWRVEKTVGEDTKSAYGSVGLEAPSGTFVEWADITTETAVGWAKAALGDDEVAKAEAAVDAELVEAATPTTGAGLPW